MEHAIDESVRVVCPICTSNSDSTFLVYRGFRLARCQNCNFLFVNPRPTEEALFHLYANPKTNPFMCATHEPIQYELPSLLKVVKNIRHYVPTGKLLEIGCGRGDFLREAKRNGFSVSGCDIFGGQVPRSNGISFFDGTLTQARFPSNSFDVVVTRNTLEHLFDPSLEIREIWRILRPGGYIYIKVPNAQFEHGLLCRTLFRKSHNFDPPYHLNYFEPTLLKLFLKKGKFAFVSWSIEQPTFCPKWPKHLVRQAAFRSMQILSFLTWGRFFPKVLLSCVAKKECQP